MKKFIRNVFIPNKSNKYEPYGLRFKTLAAYLLILIILELGVNLFAGPRTTQKALAASNISAAELTVLINNERVARGLSALNTDGRLDSAAYNKCIDMFASQYWDHVSPSGTTPWYFISQAGYPWVYAGENLAKGFSSSSAVVNAWMNSPGHRANIISSNYHDCGSAIMTGNLGGVQTTLCVQMYGTQEYAPAPAAPSVPSYQSPTNPESSSAPQAPATQSQQQGPPAPPEITKPKDGDILNDNKPAIGGRASKDTQVTIFDQESQIGIENTESNGDFIFKPLEILKEGEHKVNAEDYYGLGPKSARSKTVNFTIDTIPPVIDENSLHADLIQKGNTEQFKVGIQVGQNPSEVTTSVDHYSLILNANKNMNDLYEGTLIPPPTTLTENPRKLTIIANDQAGNKASYLITIPEPAAQQNTAQRIIAAIRSSMPQDFQSTVRILYAILGLWIFVLLLIDGAVVYNKGIVRVDSHSRAHLAIIFLMLTGILFASLGNII